MADLKKSSGKKLRRSILNKHKSKLIKRKTQSVKRSALKKKGFRASKGKSKYKQGKFWSKKNQKEYIFRSAYEFGYFHILELDDTVISYIVEPFQVKYRFDNVQRTYWPDLLVLYADGSMKIIEIKPASLVGNRKVQAKAAGCRLFIKARLKNTTYEFITEHDIFSSDADYKRLVKMIK